MPLTCQLMSPEAGYESQFDAPAPAPYSRAMPLPPGFVPPYLPTKAPQPPTGEAWLHEIKHDGFRVVARKDGDRIRRYSRPGNDLTYRFTLIVEALVRLRSRSCIIDREAVLRGQGTSIIYFGVDRNPRCLGLPIWCDLAAL
jgi:ATP-dependent DNA ligase